MIRGAVWLAGAAALAAGIALPAHNREQDLAADFEGFIKPLLKEECFTCHGDRRPSAGISFTAYDGLASVREDAKIWHRAAKEVAEGRMPPKGGLSQEERTRFAQWVAKTVPKAVEDEGPARPTMRRLNQREYTNTIRDLLGIETDLAKTFPSDEVGEGFDSIGDVLTLSPLHLERYVSAAEKLAAQAIWVPQFTERRYDPTQMEFSGGVNLRDNQAAFYSSGTGAFFHTFPASGEYRIKVEAWGQQAGSHPAMLDLDVGASVPKRFNVPGVRGKPTFVEMSVQIPRREQRKIGVTFANDYYAPNHPDPTQRDRNLWVTEVTISGPYGQPDPLPELHQWLIPDTPAKGSEAAYARRALDKFATRAYRRPVTEPELDRLMQVYASEEGFLPGMRLAVTAVLTSPSFLFRPETESGPLTPHALASRLSYFLWSSMPDEGLMGAASEGRLGTEQELRAQVERMLRDPKADSFAEGFAMQWLQLDRLEERAPDPDLFPSWSEDLKGDMLEETRRFFLHVMREDRPILDFLNADYSFLNGRLADLYGVAGISGNEFRMVRMGEAQRSGVLTHGSVLTVTSNPTRTSPVKRGKWVLEQILGEPPPPPPPGADVFAEDVRDATALTLREKMERHRSDPACANCHTKMDSLGFGFENYDAIGAWRSQEDGKAIDASGELPGDVEFTGPEELTAILVAEREKFERCLTEKMLTYALGRGLTDADAEQVDAITRQAQQGEGRFSALVTAIALSEPFRSNPGP